MSERADPISLRSGPGCGKTEINSHTREGALLHDSMGRAAKEPDGVGSAPLPEVRPRASAFSYTELPCVSGFDGLVDPSAYAALPDDWMIGLSDVVTSTAAIETGRYKAVNTAGAAVISAVANALGTLDFPFVFGGDGASFAVAPGQAREASAALAATVSWVGKELGLNLRGAVVTVGEIRTAGHDVKVARFAASRDVAYAMFSGGGRAWAEGQMKTGKLHLPPAPPDARPDLTGLSCRFQDIEAANGVILSLIVRPVGATEDSGFVALLGNILAIIANQPRAAHPMPERGPRLQWPPGSFFMEARLQRRRGWPLIASTLAVGWRTLLAQVIFRNDIEIGGFSPERYRRQMVENSDFRKFDDGLMMTLDCTSETADRLEAALATAQARNVARFGLHRQGSALVTCMVPSAMRPDHIHFVDGAAGGYAMAARDLKSGSL